MSFFAGHAGHNPLPDFVRAELSGVALVLGLEAAAGLGLDEGGDLVDVLRAGWPAGPAQGHGRLAKLALVFGVYVAASQVWGVT